MRTIVALAVVLMLGACAGMYVAGDAGGDRGGMDTSAHPAP